MSLSGAKKVLNSKHFSGKLLRDGNHFLNRFFPQKQCILNGEKDTGVREYIYNSGVHSEPYER